MYNFMSENEAFESAGVSLDAEMHKTDADVRAAFINPTETMHMPISVFVHTVLVV